MFKTLLLCGLGYVGFKATQHCINSKKEDKAVDIASKASFPASDPPSGNQFTSTEPRNQNFQGKAPAHP